MSFSFGQFGRDVQGRIGGSLINMPTSVEGSPNNVADMGAPKIRPLSLDKTVFLLERKGLRNRPTFLCGNSLRKIPGTQGEVQLDK